MGVMSDTRNLYRYLVDNDLFSSSIFLVFNSHNTYDVHDIALKLACIEFGSPQGFRNFLSKVLKTGFCNLDKKAINPPYSVNILDTKFVFTK